MLLIYSKLRYLHHHTSSSSSSSSSMTQIIHKHAEASNRKHSLVNIYILVFHCYGDPCRLASSLLHRPLHLSCVWLHWYKAASGFYVSLKYINLFCISWGCHEDCGTKKWKKKYYDMGRLMLFVFCFRHWIYSQLAESLLLIVLIFSSTAHYVA